MKKVFTAFLALSVGLVSCNKSEDLVGGSSGDAENKVIALGISKQALTKALTDGIEADHEVGFTGGYIVFTDQGDRITNVFNLINDDLATVPPTGTDKDNPLVNGDDIIIDLLEYKDPLNNNKQVNYFFEVNGDARYVHVFGNTAHHDLVFSSTSNGVIDAYLSNFAVGAKALYSGGDVAKVPLYGVGAIQDYTDGPGEFSDLFSGDVDKIAQVEITPIASRLEMAQMTADNTKLSYLDDNGTTYTLSDYELEAIFLNYFHTGMAYNGKQASSTGFVAFNSLDDFKEDGSSTNPWYNFINRNIFHDFDSNAGIATTSSLVTVPNYTTANTAVWAYNMFQASTPASQQPEDALPHMVLKIKPTVTKNPAAGPDFPGMDNDGYSYITVRRYTEQGTGTAVSAFEGGYVYYINNLLFGIENLKEVPEWREPITAEVMFKVMKWQTKQVNIDLD